MSWDSIQTASSNIAYTDWNDMVPYIKSVIATSGNIASSVSKGTWDSVYSSLSANSTKYDSVYSSYNTNSTIFPANISTNNKYLILSTHSTTDHSGNGLAIQLNAGEALAQNEVVRLGSGGTFVKAAMTAASTANGLLGFTTAATSSGSSGVFLTNGLFADASWSWTPGSPLYVSASTAGLITSTAPSTSGNIVRIIGAAISSSEIYFCPDNTYIQVT